MFLSFLPGILIFRGQPRCSLNIGVMVVRGELLIRPLSDLSAKDTLTCILHELPVSITSGIQQQEEKLQGGINLSWIGTPRKQALWIDVLVDELSSFSPIFTNPLHPDCLREIFLIAKKKKKKTHCFTLTWCLVWLTN